MYDFQEQTVYAVFVLISLKTLYRASNIFFSLERTLLCPTKTPPRLDSQAKF